MRGRALAISLVVITACTTQTAPPRETLPDVAAVVAPPRSCAFTVGPAQGVAVNSTLAGTAAEGTLRAGDIIVAIDGVETPTDERLVEFMGGTEVGQEVAIEILREGVRQTVNLVLGSGVVETSAPMIGVTITTSYEDVAPDDVPVAGGLDGRYTRLALVGGDLFALDPIAPSVVALDLDVPELPWLAAGGILYRVEGTAPDSTIVGHDGSEVALPDNVSLIGLLGSLGDSLVAALEVANEGLRVAAVDPGSGSIVWEYAPPPDLGQPLGTISDSAASELILGLVPDGSDQPTFQVLSALDGSVLAATDDLTALAGGRAFGWFDDTTILGQGADSNLVLVDTVTGEVTPVSLPVPLRPELRMWAVGDGVHVLIQDGTTLISAGLGTDVETRPLIARCEIDYIDQIGTGRL